MNALQDLGSLKRHWQAQTPTPPLPELTALRLRVAADTRANWRTLLLVTLGTLAVLGVSLLHALRNDEANAWFGFLFAAGFVALVWALAMWLSRGTWRPRDESVAAHLEVSIRRCRAVIRGAPLGIVLYFAGLAGSLAWKQRAFGTDWQTLLEGPGMIIAGWIGAPLYSLGMLWNARRQQRRLHMLESLQRQLNEG